MKWEKIYMFPVNFARSLYLKHHTIYTFSAENEIKQDHKQDYNTQQRSRIIVYKQEYDIPVNGVNTIYRSGKVSK